MTDLKVIKGGKSANPSPAKQTAPLFTFEQCQRFGPLDHKRYLEQIRDLNRDFANTLDLAIGIIERDMKPKKPYASPSVKVPF